MPTPFSSLEDKLRLDMLYVMNRKAKKKRLKELRDEYDFHKLKGDVRGKYAKRFKAGNNLDACPCLRRSDNPAQA